MKQWQDFLEKLKKEFKKEIFNKWVSSLKVNKFDARNIYIEVQNYFQFIWFEEHISPKLKNFYNNNGYKIQVHLVNKQSQFPHNNNIASFNLKEDGIDASKTLDSFVVASDNEMIYNFFKFFIKFNKNKISKDDEFYLLKDMNPVFIYGEKNSGKTHLLLSIANILKDEKCIFIKAKTFIHNVIQSMRFSKMELVRATYRKVNFLIIDDIHELSNKFAVQEEFFNTFNVLVDKGAKIILSSDKSPEKLENVENRLISRFEWGISLNLKKIKGPDLKKFIINRSTHMQLNLKKEQIEFFISNFSDINLIEKALQSLILHTHLSKKNSLSNDEIRKTLQPLILTEQKNKITFDFIMNIICDVFDVKKDDLMGKSHAKRFAYPRKLGIYFCRDTLSLTYVKIASLFKKDHSTIMSSYKIIKNNLIKNDVDTLSQVNKIKELIEKY